ncbi:tetratricopeptide repeat protein, partial [Anabaena sp. CS-542/02]|uniref:tetratricopeptide repeat protein n=1 Tax=Anabaena sp. CS-542/02 TaxID=3021719 RepID=UPI0023310DBF
PSVASSLNNLAGLYYSQRRYDQAEPLYLQALELSKRLLGDNHPSVATSLNNLAGLYYSQRRYDQAEPLYLQALKLCKRLLGDNHPHTIIVRENLAACRQQTRVVSLEGQLLKFRLCTPTQLPLPPADC